jgi:hypothetical protein
MTPPPAAASSPPAKPATHGLSFRAKLVLGVCGLVLLTGTVVLWLANRSARASTEALTGSVFREVSGRAATHTRGFVLRAAPVVESLAQLTDKGLAVDDPERLPPQQVRHAEWCWRKAGSHHLAPRPAAWRSRTIPRAGRLRSGLPEPLIRSRPRPESSSGLTCSSLARFQPCHITYRPGTHHS